MPASAAIPQRDWRSPDTRVDLFLRFYEFQLRHRSHPGGVYYVLPYLADTFGWDDEQRAWAGWINANTQNPVTTLLLMQAGDRPQRADRMLTYYANNIETLAWDTDRRYHRKAFLQATVDYLALTGDSVRYWANASRGGWAGCWSAARALPTMGRLSAWSYLEYLRILRVPEIPDADTLYLDDLAGSRSHRNGLLLVTGQEDRMMWKRNPTPPTRYSRSEIRMLEVNGEALLTEIRRRTNNHPHAGYLTLESALCTFKSWHVPNRRYSGVYNDMLHDRIRSAEQAHGRRFDPIWESRLTLPVYLRMESNPDDPGCVPVKQNHFLDTGRPVVIGREDPELLSQFDLDVMAGKHRGQRRWS